MQHSDNKYNPTKRDNAVPELRRLVIAGKPAVRLPSGRKYFEVVSGWRRIREGGGL